MTSTPASGHSAKRMRSSIWRGSNDILPLRKYSPTPTSGTAPLHSSHDYGYADFYPAKTAAAAAAAAAGQGEGAGELTLNERTIRYGYIDSPCVDNEHVSHHDIVYDRLLDSRVFQELQTFAAGVAQRQWARGGVSSSRLPSLPNRSVHTDERREEWLRGLANPRLPLSVLVNSIPYGHRGERLLESLSTHKVPLQRAIWAIRLIGVYEMFGQQTRMPDHKDLKTLEQIYTGQWTKTFTQFLEHTLGSAPTGASESDIHTSSTRATPLLSSSASTPASSLASRDQKRPARQPMTPEAWSLNWTYCLTLLHAQYDQGLLDQRHLVSWLVNQFRQVSVDKCILLLGLVDNYTSEISKSRNPLRKLISAVVYRIDQTANYVSLQKFRESLRIYLVSLFTQFPDAFVEPSTWDVYKLSLEQASGSCTPDTQARLGQMLAQVGARNMKFAHLGKAKERTVPTSPIHTLNLVTPDSLVDKVYSTLFGSSSTTGGSIAASIVRVVCYWAVEDETKSTVSQFRSLFAARLVRQHLDSAAKHKPENAASAPHTQLQSAIVGFLDIFALPGGKRRAASERRVCVLVERLADVGCFSISKYLQLLTARGDFFGSNLATARSQRHLAYATHLAAGSPDVDAQKQMLLYGFEMADGSAGEGSRQVSDSDDAVRCGKLKQEISASLPFLVAYACAAPLRARSNNKPPSVDTEITQWWMPKSEGAAGATGSDSAEAATPQSMPTAKQLSGNRIFSPLAHEPCMKDWISPITDHIADERLLSQDVSPECMELLTESPRDLVDLVVRQRLMPIVYDFVVKDIKVGVDNWRVITQPGTSLLNGRQAATVVRILSASGFYSQLLDFLLWLLNHSKSSQAISIAHASLRQFTVVWRLIGRMPEAISQVESVYAANSSGSMSFDFEAYRTTECWCLDSDERQTEGFLQTLRKDYDSFVDSHVQSLLQPSHLPSQASTGKELLQLAQRLIQDRLRDATAVSSDETDWAVLQCFQKLSRWAQSVAQKSDLGNSPGLLPDSAAASLGSGSSRAPKLQSVLACIASEATQAAMVTGRSLTLAPQHSADRAKDDALQRCFVELCASYISWFAIGSGLALSPEIVSPLLLKSLGLYIDSWTLSRNAASTTLPVPASSVASPLYSVSDIEMAMQISYVWIKSLLSSGCLQISHLIPWLIERFRGEVAQQSVAQYACLAGIMRALSAPSVLSAKSEDARDMDSSYGCAGGSSDTHRLCEILEAGSNWHIALSADKLCRIQAVELVFTCASVGGRLRGVGASQLEVILVRATTEFAQSAWIQSAIDYIPMSEQDAAKAGAQSQGYYNMLEIYRANIEGLIKDPSIILPVKRATLRCLLTLCEGADPESEGFSAMTTAEVAHRLRRTIRRFWFGPASKGKSPAEVYKCATIINSLLLFASTALQESEASTDAFAIAAGATAMTNSSIGGMVEAHPGTETGASMQDIDAISQCLSHGSEQVQFITNTTAYLAACVQEAILSWNADTRNATNAKSLADLRCSRLAEVLSTLSPDIILKLIEVCSSSLFLLNAAHIRVAGDLSTSGGSGDSSDSGERDDAHNQRQRSAQPSPGSGSAAQKRVSAIIRASSMDVASLVAPPFAQDIGSDTGQDGDAIDGDMSRSGHRSSEEFEARGSALAKLIQRLINTLVDHVNTEASDNSSSLQQQKQEQQQQQQQQQRAGVGSDRTDRFAPGSLLSSIRDIACGLVGQLQVIVAAINPAVASSLSLSIVAGSAKQSEAEPHTETSNSPFGQAPGSTFVDAEENISPAEDKKPLPSSVPVDAQKLCPAIFWRLQAAQPLCYLMREFPDEFAVDEWLLTLVTLCLAPICQNDASISVSFGGEFYQFLLDFAALTNESVSTSMRKRTLGLLRLVAPLLRSAVRSKHYASVLGRLFPFDMATTLTRDIQPLVSSTHVAGLDNPWIWIESLEFVPLASLNSASAPASGLEGMTPFTLRGMLAQETAALNRQPGSSSKGGSGYLGTAPGAKQPGVVRRLQYLENPYFPMQPSVLLPLAETPIPWQLFGGKRRRMDSETRLVWRYHCKSAFGSE
ncbi:hypothetical protein GGI12_000245 [Dipsacomyces acuminosporus]|nr:hypothetical protein GGI12_000245 [Dipsacomyces acuminosporus]